MGVGGSRVRDLLIKPRRPRQVLSLLTKLMPWSQRGASINTNDEREQTLNQLLVEMDGFDSHQAVVVVAATTVLTDSIMPYCAPVASIVV